MTLTLQEQASKLISKTPIPQVDFVQRDFASFSDSPAIRRYLRRKKNRASARHRPERRGLENRKPNM